MPLGEGVGIIVKESSHALWTFLWTKDGFKVRSTNRGSSLLVG